MVTNLEEGQLAIKVISGNWLPTLKAEGVQNNKPRISTTVPSNTTGYHVLPDDDAAYTAWKPSEVTLVSAKNLSVRAVLKDVIGWGREVPQ